VFDFEHRRFARCGIATFFQAGTVKQPAEVSSLVVWAEQEAPEMSDSTRVLVVDHEPLGREKLMAALEACSETECVGQAWDSYSCIEAVRATSPSVVVLDLEIPDAMVLIAELASLPLMPHIVFSTPYNEHAVRTFDQLSVSYVLKPASEAGICQAVRKAKENGHIRKGPEWLRLLPQLLQLRPSPPPSGGQRLAVRTNGRILILDAAEVQYIEADGNYVQVHCGSISHTLRETLHSVEQVLGPSDFIRIHRSVIVNARYVREVQPWPTGECILRMRNGKELTVTRKYKQNLARIASLGIGKYLLLLA
jgi:two-component system LytT family response regulator